MADQIRVNYPALEDMANHCQRVSERLQQTAANAQKIAGQMQNGALVGPPGEVYVQALNIFYGKVMKLSGKFSEEANDIRQAMNDMRQADNSAGSNF
jgi:WXG100 family type VII secretion target